MADKKDYKKGLISVVMSNYNTSINYLKKAIDSVLNQTYSNFEFIIIDDGSTDDSLEFIKSYDDPRIRLIINAENIGLTKSLNKGLEVAQGEFIARMDTDDICYPERFEKQVEYLKNHPDTIVCSTWAESIDENDNDTQQKWVMAPFKDMKTFKICLLFSNDPNIVHPSVMINHSLLSKYKLKYNENFSYAQDYELWSRCSKYSNCYILPSKLIKYRIHSESICLSKKDAQDECAYRVINNQLDYLGLELNDDIKKYHFRYLTQMKPYDTKIKKWIKEIIKGNKKHRIYDHRLLKKILWYRWSEICYSELSVANISHKISILLSLSLRCKLYLFKIKYNYYKKIKTCNK